MHVAIASAACTLCLGACGGGKSASHTRAPSTTATTAEPDDLSTSTTNSPPPTAPLTTTTVESPNALLQALLGQGQRANVKVVYDTTTGRATFIRRGADTVFADGSGIDFNLAGVSYQCTGSGDGETCTRVSSNDTRSDIDVYTALVADALASSVRLTDTTTSIVGRTADCVEITGTLTAGAGQTVDACIDDLTGVLLRVTTTGPPDAGTKLVAVSLAAPAAADFQLPAPPTATGP